MSDYPVFLRLSGRPVLVVGGGDVASRKLAGLFAAGAQINLVAPEALPAVQEHARAKRLHWQRRSYETADLQNVELVVAATDDAVLQKRLSAECRERKIWINVADQPELGDIALPAIFRQGDVQVAISTGGSAPALSRFLRKKLEPLLGPEYAELARLVRRVRPDVLKWSAPRRAMFWKRLINDDILESIRREGLSPTESKVKEWMHESSSI